MPAAPRQSVRRLVVEAGDLNPPGAVADTRKRLHEPPGGIRRNALERGVCVGRERLDVEANAQRSLVAERALRPTVGQPRGVALPQRAVGVEQFDVAADDLVEARAADFFFALDDPPNPDGEFAGVGADRADRRESHCKLALIVRRAACEQLAVALCWLERRRFPEVERIDGLDVVMVIEQECEICRGPAGRRRQQAPHRWREAGASRSHRPRAALRRDRRSGRAPYPPRRCSARGKVPRDAQSILRHPVVIQSHPTAILCASSRVIPCPPCRGHIETPGCDAMDALDSSSRRSGCSKASPRLNGRETLACATRSVLAAP